PIFKEPKLRDWMKHLTVRRYWPALPIGEWKSEPGQVREVINLPNERPVAGTEYAVIAETIALNLPVDKEEYQAYKPNLSRYRDLIVQATKAAAGKQTFDLAKILKELLTDRGSDEFPG